MHKFYDNAPHVLGELARVKNCNLPDTKQNPTGMDAPVWNDDMSRIGSIQCGTSVMVLKRPEGFAGGDKRMSMFVEVVAPVLGRCWVRACDIETRNT